jgi:hypothetical protein
MGNGLGISLIPFETGNTKNLKCKIIDESLANKYPVNANCNTDDILQYMGSDHDLSLRTSDNCKSVNVSVDVDYELFVKFKGDVQSITNYITGLFNNVHTLYKRENISIALAQINIHTAKDNFTHISAGEDLESFRKKYPNTNKTLKILLSGYSKSNQATLGGIANIGTICLPSYSYGFANVIGTYVTAPNYSWDVFLVTHELGHILGSKHTHACAWGPGKNKAIDNCAKLEGSCASPGIPLKGTIMSYCYLSGMPGIDFTLGFGTEPGDLIRQKVKSASCLSSYIPSTKTLDKSNSLVEANLECTDGSYTHYYFDNNTIDPKDDLLLLSINKNGNDIGSIGDGSLSIKLITTKNYGSKKGNQITAAYVDKTKPWFVANKYWDIKTNKKLSKPVDIKYYFHTKDLDDLKGSAGVFAPSELKLFNILPPGNPNPESNHANTQAQQFISYNSSAKKTLNTYLLSQSDSSVYLMELNTQTLSSSGFGISPKSQGFVHFQSMSSASQGINFKTSKEINCSYFTVEKSLDEIQFDSVGRVEAKGNSTIPVLYKYKPIGHEFGSPVFYRLKACNTSNEIMYSPAFSDYTPAKPSNTVSYYPNPVKSGDLFVNYQNNLDAGAAEIYILDIYGKIVNSFKSQLTRGNNFFKINVTGLSNGIYFLSINDNLDVQKISFTVHQ